MNKFLAVAYSEAVKGGEEGGIPIGACLVYRGRVIGKGHNLRVQTGDPTAHAEMVAIRDAGRRTIEVLLGCTLYTTLSPCEMCAGAVLLYGIPKVCIGETKNFEPYGIDMLEDRYVHIKYLKSIECVKLLEGFIKKNPHVWNEDIGR